MKKFIALISVIALMIVALPIASAQDAEAVGTLTFTEDEINDVFWVTNPANRHLTRAYVDLQAENDGQVEISAVYTWRVSRTATRSVEIAVVIQPRISSGRLYWDVVEITADGQAASAEIVRQVNAYLMASWHRWIAGNAPAGRLTSVSISDDDITFTYTPRQ